MRSRASIPILVLLFSWATALAGPATIIVCAPGYPGNTEQAQPAMDELAAGIAASAGWPRSQAAAEYHEDEARGMKRLAEADAALALVPLPFYLKHREELDLDPILEIDQTGIEAEVWTLVAGRGALKSPGDLDGWTVAGVPGYAPSFIRRVALAEWGDLPDGADVRFTSRVLSYLRKSSKGEPVAVLLDAGQAGALDSLPFKEDLAVVARSRPVPGTLLCAVGDRLDPERATAVSEALRALTTTDEGRELLASLRIAGVREPDIARLRTLERAYSGTAGGDR